MSTCSVFEGRITQPIPHYQRRYLREALAKELFALREEMGFSNIHRLARAAKVSIATISALEHGRYTEDYVNLLSLNKIAAALSRTVIVTLDGAEKFFSMTTPVEDLHAVGAAINFSSEG